MSAADGLVRNEEVAGATPAALTISDGRQSSNAPVPKNRVSLRAAWVQSLHHPPMSKTSPKENSMKPVIRYQSQLLFRKSYKPNRLIRVRPAAEPSVTFRSMRRFGVKPQLELVS